MLLWSSEGDFIMAEIMYRAVYLFPDKRKHCDQPFLLRVNIESNIKCEVNVWVIYKVCLRARWPISTALKSYWACMKPGMKWPGWECYRHRKVTPSIKLRSPIPNYTREERENSSVPLKLRPLCYYKRQKKSQTLTAVKPQTKGGLVKLLVTDFWIKGWKWQFQVCC